MAEHELRPDENPCNGDILLMNKDSGYVGKHDHLRQRPVDRSVGGGHSYGAATAATAVADGLKVQTLVTLDPVSYIQPNFQQVASNIATGGQWLNFVAAGGGLTLPNAIAGIGSAWNDTTAGFATSTINVSAGHGGLEGGDVYKALLGVSVPWDFKCENVLNF